MSALADALADAAAALAATLAAGLAADLPAPLAEDARQLGQLCAHSASMKASGGVSGQGCQAWQDDHQGFHFQGLEPIRSQQGLLVNQHG